MIVGLRCAQPNLRDSTLFRGRTMNTATQVLPNVIASPRLARLGEFMRRHRGLIMGVQWVVLAFYLFLVIVPAFLPLPGSDAHLWTSLTLFAQFVFWEIGRA